jgi:uncharacterized protein (TIGR02646 family)
VKHIQKGDPPQALIAWIKGHRDGQKPEFDGPDFPKQAVRAALLAEQGCICAYTMIAIRPPSADRAAEACHIEHIKPQSRSREDGKVEETVEFTNLLACYPGTIGEQHPGFGATKKGDEWQEAIFLSPLMPTCEKRLKFRLDGTVSATNGTDTQAVHTIDLLGLDCNRLRELRRAAIRAAGLGLDAEEAVSLAEAKRVGQNAKKRRADGLFVGYCIALAAAAEEYAVLLEKKAKRKQHIRAAQKRKRK